MKRLTAYVSGSVQKVGYRARVVQIANALGLKGWIENLPDGRVRIIAEGDGDKLKWFEEAIDIRNTLIRVSSIEKGYSDAGGEFSGFCKLVAQGETDSRLDQGVEVLKEILVAVKDININLGGKMDSMLDKQDTMLGKMDSMLDKQDTMLGKMDSMLDKQDDMLSEIKDARKDLKTYMDQRFERIEIELSEMKATLRAKGLI
ncbi:Acylphosphatase [uncultured archaeon]|nr:Acylphosphatase [uncultured archaeon]